MKKHYELMVILHPELTREENEKLLSTVKKHLTGKKDEGIITFEDIWGKQAFAYPIAKQDSGFYAILNFETEGSRLADIEKELRLEPKVLRHLITILPNAYIAITREELGKQKDEKAAKIAEKEEIRKEEENNSKETEAKEEKVIKEEAKEETKKKEVKTEEKKEIKEKPEKKETPKKKPVVKKEVKEAVEEKNEEEKPKKKTAKKKSSIDELDKTLDSILNG